MDQVLCPECGGNKVVDLGNNLYECRYCGKKFSLSPSTSSVAPISTPAGGIVTIHGYTQWFAVNPDVSIHVNGQTIGKVGKGETLQLRFDAPCELKFVCSVRSTTLNVNPAVDTDIYLSFDRMSGCLVATTGGQNVNDEKKDKPSIWLDILSFIIPIVGLVLYFVKRKEYPNCAKSYLICAICGFVLGFILNIASN